ncbi:MAG: hypothetical protein ACLQIB_47200 [Isosphaeraceae bacterium]
MLDLQVVWAYVDPVTILPVTSIIATLVGVIMLCGRSIQRAVVRWARLGRSGGTGLQGAHFALKHRRDGESKAAAARPSGLGYGQVSKAPSDRSDRRLS